jgi:hypothetical protein
MQLRKTAIIVATVMHRVGSLDLKPWHKTIATSHAASYTCMYIYPDIYINMYMLMCTVLQ